MRNMSRDDDRAGFSRTPPRTVVRKTGTNASGGAKNAHDDFVAEVLGLDQQHDNRDYALGFVPGQEQDVSRGKKGQRNAHDDFVAEVLNYNPPSNCDNASSSIGSSNSNRSRNHNTSSSTTNNRHNGGSASSSNANSSNTNDRHSNSSNSSNIGTNRDTSSSNTTNSSANSTSSSAFCSERIGMLSATSSGRRQRTTVADDFGGLGLEEMFTSNKQSKRRTFAATTASSSIADDTTDSFNNSNNNSDNSSTEAPILLHNANSHNANSDIDAGSASASFSNSAVENNNRNIGISNINGSSSHRGGGNESSSNMNNIAHDSSLRGDGEGSRSGGCTIRTGFGPPRRVNRNSNSRHNNSSNNYTSEGDSSTITRDPNYNSIVEDRSSSSPSNPIHSNSSNIIDNRSQEMSMSQQATAGDTRNDSRNTNDNASGTTSSDFNLQDLLLYHDEEHFFGTLVVRDSTNHNDVARSSANTNSANSPRNTNIVSSASSTTGGQGRRPRARVEDFGGGLSDILTTRSNINNANYNRYNNSEMNNNIVQTTSDSGTGSNYSSSRDDHQRSLQDNNYYGNRRNSNDNHSDSDGLLNSSSSSATTSTRTAVRTASNTVTNEDFGGGLGDILPRKAPKNPRSKSVVAVSKHKQIKRTVIRKNSKLLAEDCAVCICEFEVQQICQVLPCSHCFHHGCWQKHVTFEKNRTSTTGEKTVRCPLCRFDTANSTMSHAVASHSEVSVKSPKGNNMIYTASAATVEGKVSSLVQPKNPRSTPETLQRMIDKSATLGSRCLVQEVQCPKDCDLDEWLATKTVEIFDEINLLAGCLQPYCTKDTCPLMKAGESYQWAWADGEKYLEPHDFNAPDYFRVCLQWADEKINDTSLFPIERGVPFPPNFKSNLKKIFKRLFRLYAHVYYHHFKDLMQGHAEAHLNYQFKHFLYVVVEFDLVSLEEMEPLKELIEQFLHDRDDEKKKLQAAS